MNPARLLVLFVCVLTAAPSAARETALTTILSSLDRVQKFKMMENGRTYDLEAGGIKTSGVGDDFLRRRTPEEILVSGLSSGCGDDAFAFYRLLQTRGYEVQYIDSAALNFQSLATHFDGHAAVAVRDSESGNWILVDPTFGRIVSGDWDPSNRLYAGPAGRFWIGYRGALEKYPVHDPSGLRGFYAETLKSVPKEIWERELVRFEFTIDPSMKKADGSYTNPRVLEFVRRPDEALKALGVIPARTVKVVLADAGEKAVDAYERGPDGVYKVLVSRGAAMSAGMTDWLMKTVLRDSGAP